jgi:hypothetical protein
MFGGQKIWMNATRLGRRQRDRYIGLHKPSSPGSNSLRPSLGRTYGRRKADRQHSDMLPGAVGKEKAKVKSGIPASRFIATEIFYQES